jgi:hypothetical protein
MHQQIDSASRDAKRGCVEHASEIFGVAHCPSETAKNGRPNEQWRSPFEVGRWGRWFAAASFIAVVLVTLAPQLLADEVGRMRLAQAATTAPPESEAAEGQDRHDADWLARELAGIRHDLDVLLRRAGDESSRTGRDRETAELRKSLQAERDRASRLEQDVETQTALATKATEAGKEAAQLKQTAQTGQAELRQSLEQEHDKEEALAQELSTARTAIYAYQAAESGTADLKQSLQQEHERASRLEQDLAAARRDVETQTALATKAAAEASQLKKTADSGSADLRNSLQQERDRANRLEQDLAASRRDVEELKTAAAGAADMRKSLQQERDRATQLERDLALARSNTSTPSSTQAKAMAVTDTQPKPEDVAEAEIARLVAHARVLLGRGDIGSARIVLQRAVDMGSAEASFTLAQSYDPLILSKWGTYGTHGDARKAIDLYAKALAGGIEEAKERSEALQR